MKKILLLLLMFVVHQSFSQVTETVAFDFSNPAELSKYSDHPFTFLEGSGDYYIDGDKLTIGPVVMSFVLSGEGVVMDFYKDEQGVKHYYLAIRAWGGVTVSLNKRDYVLQSIKFTGYLGDLSVSATNKTWMAPDNNTKTVTFKNGNAHTQLTKIEVTYLRDPNPVTLTSTTPAKESVVSSFQSMNMLFESPMSVLDSKGIYLYELDAYKNRIDEAIQKLEANVSSDDNRIITLRCKEEIRKDGWYEVYVPAGAFVNSEGSVSPAFSVIFKVYADRATLKWKEVSPVPEDGAVPTVPNPIILTFNQNVKIQRNKECVLYKEHDDDPDRFIPLYLSTDNNIVEISYSEDAIDEEGLWTIKIPEGAINNTFASTDQHFRYNPEIVLTYKVENEKSIVLREAMALLQKGGGMNEAFVGYPAEGSDGRTQLVDAVGKGTNATIQELNDAMAAYMAEKNIAMPEVDSWYKISAVNTVGQKRYLSYQNGAVVLADRESAASAFTVSAINDDKTYMIQTDDGNYLHVLVADDSHVGTSSKNVTDTDQGIPHLTLAGLDIQNENTLGLLTIFGSMGYLNDKKEEGYATVDFTNTTNPIVTSNGNSPVFNETVSSGFAFVKTNEGGNIVSPVAQLSKKVIQKASEELVLQILNVDQAKLISIDEVYFLLGETKCWPNGAILQQKSSTEYLVNTSGLFAGHYTLMLPKGSFSYSRQGHTVNDIGMNVSFEIKSNEGGNTDPGETIPFNYVYTEYNVLQYLTKDVNKMVCTDMNDIVVYVHNDGTYTGLIPDSNKVVRICRLRSSDSPIATGHFYPYPEIVQDYGDSFANVFAIRLVLDEPFKEGDLINSPALYTVIIDPGTFGDANFGRYLQDPTNVSPSECLVNPKSTSIIFYVDDVNGSIKYPSSETLELAKKIEKMEGVGYPVDVSPARRELQSKIDYVEGDDALYRAAINRYYAETNVTMPSHGTYYKISAYSEDGTKSYLSFDGDQVGMTKDASMATGFMAKPSEDGSFLLIAGDGRYLSQLSPNGSLTVRSSDDNHIVLKKLLFDNVDVAKTFGMFSVQVGDSYAMVNVKDDSILEASNSLEFFDAEKTNAFMLEPVDRTTLPVPEVGAVLTPEKGSKVESLTSITVAFTHVLDVELVDPAKISISDETGNDVGKISVTRVGGKSNEYVLTFEDLPTSSYYTLWIEKGAFTFVFAEITREVGNVKANYNIVSSGITSIYINGTNEPVYDLQGRKVTGTLKAGVYIKNGKKVYIK